jgi:hypothetical protein
MRAVIAATGGGTDCTVCHHASQSGWSRVADMSILEIAVRPVRSAGFAHSTPAVGHHAELITAYFGDGTCWGK